MTDIEQGRDLMNKYIAKLEGDTCSMEELVDLANSITGTKKYNYLLGSVLGNYKPDDYKPAVRSALLVYFRRFLVEKLSDE